MTIGPTLFRMIPAGLAAALLASCAGSLNSRDTLGGSLPVESLTLDDGASVRIAETQSEPLTTMSRDGFVQRQYIVPVDGVRHQPTYLLTGLPEAGRTNSWRDAGAYPSAERALEVQGDGAFEAWNGVVGPLAAALEILVSPVGMIIAPPWTATQSPAPQRIADRAHASDPEPTNMQPTIVEETAQ